MSGKIDMGSPPELVQQTRKWEANHRLSERMAQARAETIRLYYISWKTIVFVPTKDQLPELVSYLSEDP